MHSKSTISVIGLAGIGEVSEGTDLGKIIYEAALSESVPLQDNDVIVVTQKIVSKAEGRLFKLAEIEPSLLATKIAKKTGKDPAIVELILRESDAIVRMSGKHLITKTKQGWICANAGVDLSNVSGGDVAALLPVNPDKSARRIRETIQKLSGKKIAVIISDTFGRPFRIGHTDAAIGCSGISPILDLRGSADSYGYVMKVKQTAIVDELASAAELVVGNSDERIPVAIIRGVRYTVDEDARARHMIMKDKNNLFR